MTDAPPIITCTETTAGFWALRFAYDPVMVEGIKTAVPPEFRSWNPQERYWTILARTYVDAILSAAHAIGYVVEDRTPPRPRQQQQRQQPRPQPRGTTWADALLADLDPELQKKVVRALARVLHPDLGGDARLMQQLNDADARTRRRSA